MKSQLRPILDKCQRDGDSVIILHGRRNAKEGDLLFGGATHSDVVNMVSALISRFGITPVELFKLLVGANSVDVIEIVTPKEPKVNPRDN